MTTSADKLEGTGREPVKMHTERSPAQTEKVSPRQGRLSGGGRELGWQPTGVACGSRWGGAPDGCPDGSESG